MAYERKISALSTLLLVVRYLFPLIANDLINHFDQLRQ